jgi:hypothetical protein
VIGGLDAPWLAGGDDSPETEALAELVTQCDRHDRLATLLTDDLGRLIDTAVLHPAGIDDETVAAVVTHLVVAGYAERGRALHASLSAAAQRAQGPARFEEPEGWNGREREVALVLLLAYAEERHG